MYILLSILPRNFVSWLTGAFVRLEPPTFMANILNAGFIKMFGINMEEAEPVAFRSIEDIFTRKLKPSSRTIELPFCSPADGTLVRSDKAIENQAVQVKGITYSLNELFLSESNYAWYTTIYLAPHNYHRVHAPVSGELFEMEYVPGDLWPVNEKFVNWVPQLFCKNERLNFHIKTENDGIMSLSMVGAFNVGRISTPFLKGFASNDGNRERFKSQLSQEIKAGDELGTFMLGSTVVLGFDQRCQDMCDPKVCFESKSIVMGNSLSN